ELLDYDTFVYSVLECLTSLISSKPKKSVIKYLDALCFEICQLVQLPEKTVGNSSIGLWEFYRLIIGFHHEAKSVKEKNHWIVVELYCELREVGIHEPLGEVLVA
ncbi:unnamed protein product, partial [Trichobilharzia regenti]